MGALEAHPGAVRAGDVLGPRTMEEAVLEGTRGGAVLTEAHAGRVVLVDPVGTLEPVRTALASVPGLELVHAERLPRGAGIVAVLVPPEVAGRTRRATRAARPADRRRDLDRP